MRVPRPEPTSITDTEHCGVIAGDTPWLNENSIEEGGRFALARCNRSRTDGE